MQATDQRPVPSRALLVGGTVERAAVLARDFDEVRIALPAEVTPEVVAGSGRPFACVAITGVPAAGGALEAVVRQALEAGPADLLVLLDLTDDAAAQLTDGTPLRGLQLIGETAVSGVPAALFERAADPAGVPDVAPVVAAARDGGHPSGPDAEPYLAMAEARVLRGRVADLERRLEDANAALARARQNVGKWRDRARRDARRLKRMQGSALGRLALHSDRASAKARGRLAQLPPAQRKLVLAAIVLVGLAAVAAVDVLVGVLSDVPRSGYWQIAGVELVLLALAYLILGQRRSVHRLAEAVRLLEAEPALRQAQHGELKQADARMARGLKTLEARSARLADVTAQVHATSLDSSRALAQLRRGTGGRGPAPSLLTTMHQTQALVNLFGMLPVERPVPLMGGWAASPDVMVLLLGELLEHRPRLIVECGSGVSTLWFALAIRRHGLDTRIVSLEHDERFAAATRASLAGHGVADIADIRYAPLVDVGIPGHGTPWYDRAAFADLQDIGLLFVDGPPEATGPDVRYPAVPMLKDRFAPTVTVVLDDLVRDSEQAAARAWQAELPDFELERVVLDKDAAVFRRIARD